MKSPHKAEKRKAGSFLVPAAAIVLVSALLAALTLSLNWKSIVRSAAREMFAPERSRYQEKIASLEKDIARLKARLEEAASPAIPGAMPDDSSPAGGTGAVSEPGCQDIEAAIRKTVASLAAMPGIAEHLSGPDTLLPRLEAIRKKLFDHPPIVVRETDSLYSILTNTAHFYRVLGRDDLMLLHAIVSRGGETTEELLALLYQWSCRYDECGRPGFLALPLDRLYEYAGFFLNTLGGQAYIFRRGARTRVLARYYCAMIIDRANARVANRYGIDLRPVVGPLVRELQVTPGLRYRRTYLENLNAIRARYQAPEAATAPR